MRTLPLMTIAFAAAMVAGCVSRNVETISAEAAAAMAPPPAPLTSEDRAAALIAEPGFTVIARVDPDVSTIPDGVLYVIVRVAGRVGGPPLAVKRLPADLPAEVRVTAADSMIPGTPLVAAMDVTVRLDQDGDAWSNQAGDLAGTVGPVAVGDTVEIVLTPTDLTPAQ